MAICNFFSQHKKINLFAMLQSNDLIFLSVSNKTNDVHLHLQYVCVLGE
jgi:hypothetical protein